MKRKLIYIIGAVCVLALVVGSIFIFREFREPKAEFKGFIEGVIYEMTFEEILADEQGFLAEVKILRKLPRSEAEKLAGYGIVEKSSTFFEALVKTNHLKDKSLDNKKIIIMQFGIDEWQVYGDPIYKLGDEMLMVLVKNRPTDECYGSLGGANGIFDIEEKDSKKYLYKRLGVFTELGIDPVFMTEDEKVKYKNGKDNPVHYTQKFELEEFVSVFKEKHNKKENKS